jgi:hypothetical protein
MQAKGTEKGQERAELPKLVASEITHPVTILIVRFRRWHELAI